MIKFEWLVLAVAGLLNGDSSLARPAALDAGLTQPQPSFAAPEAGGARILLVGAPPSPSKPPTGKIVYEGQGVTVPADFGCAHDTGYVMNNGTGAYHTDPEFNVRMNAMRTYGMGGLEWNRVELSPGKFTWGLWDTALPRMRDKAGVKTIILNLYNVPKFLERPGAGGSWVMQPVSAEAVDRWLTAVKGKVDQYGLNLIIEVANEAFSKSGGVSSQFWKGDSATLMGLSNAVLDWRKKHPSVRVWGPSVAAFRGNDTPYLNWMGSYPRANEFDAAPIHLYFLTATAVGQAASAGTAWTAFVEIRDGLRAKGLTMPIVDGEHGYAGGAVSPGTTFNYAVRAVLLGIRQVCWFYLGSKDGGNGEGDTNLGEPYKNAWAKEDLEAATALAGKTIVKVIDTGTGRYWVQTK